MDDKTETLKKVALILISVLIFTVSFAVGIFADSAESDTVIDIDLDGVNMETADDFLKDSGVDLSSPETVKNITAASLLNYALYEFKSAIKKPVQIFICVLIVSLVNEAVVSMSASQGIYGEIFTLICFLLIAAPVISSFVGVIEVLKSQEAFMASYIPIYAALSAASGNTLGAGAYSSLVLYTAEAVVLISSQILKPILLCMLVMSCTQAINPELPNLTGTLKKAIVYIVGMVMTVFVGVIGLQTAAANTGNQILLRAGKYLVSSFVPIIGMSLSESYKAVSQSLGTLKAQLGALGMVIVVLILSIPIITMCVYRFAFILLEWTCSITGSNRLSSLMRGIGDVYSLAATLLSIYALMLLISTGIVMAAGSGAIS